MATTAYQAHSMLLDIHVEAFELRDAGFPDFEMLRLEAATWMDTLGSSPSRMLTKDEAEKLTWFAKDFKAAHDPAIQQITASIVQQLTGWQSQPISDAQLFEIRETIHYQFVRTPKSDVLSETSDLLGKAEEIVKEVAKWTGRAEETKGFIKEAKKFEDVNKGLKKITDKLGEAKKVTDLAKDIAKMTGTIGKTPGGVDDIAAFESALNVMDFAISKAKVPGLTQLWDGYIFKAAKICAKQLHELKELLYKGDRSGGVAFFFDQHHGDAVAPNIEDAIVHGVDTQQHFPGGQPMLNFMWQLMRTPDAIRSVPDGIEDFFVEWRGPMNAGVHADELQSDDDVSNLWNAFSRERAPNILPWVKRNRESVWVKLYGGMPAPS
jgi:hypothetical protein